MVKMIMKMMNPQKPEIIIQHSTSTKCFSEWRIMDLRDVKEFQTDIKSGLKAIIDYHSDKNLSIWEHGSRFCD